MNRNRRRYEVALASLAGVLLILGTCGSAVAKAPGTTEVNVTHGNGGGEPEIGLDPVHHTMVLAYTTHDSKCGLEVSGDNGQSWQSTPFPADPGPTPGVPYHNCSDPAVAVGPDGAIYVAGGWWDQPTGPADYYNIYVSRSSDGGQTWSAPAFATGDKDAVDVLALGRNTGHSDRAFMTVDNSTGTVYVSAADLPRNQRWVVASHDQATTFGKPQAIDSADYPEAGGEPLGDYIPSSANGVLAISYVAGPASTGSACPCNVFETSTDDGVSWTRRSTPVAANWTAADPAHPGHFAILSGAGLSASTSNPDYLVISTTFDYGKTWSTPQLVGQTPANQRYQPWINFSPKGVLGVGYKTVYGTSVNNDTYDYWSALSCDGGLSFSSPVRISGNVSGAEPAGGDDFSFVALDNNHLYAGWGDMRTSPTDPTPASRSVFFGSVPVTTYANQSGSPMSCPR